MKKQVCLQSHSSLSHHAIADAHRTNLLFMRHTVVHFDTPFEWKRIPGIEDPAGVRILRLTWPSVQGENVQYDLKAKLPDEEGDIGTVNIIQDSSQNRAILSFPTEGDSGNQQQPSAGPGKAERKNLIKVRSKLELHPTCGYQSQCFCVFFMAVA